MDETHQMKTHQLKAVTITKLTVLMANLTDREREVLESRFALKGGQSQTLEAIGQRLGVTRERIRQIEDKAIRRLRTQQNKKKSTNAKK